MNELVKINNNHVTTDSKTLADYFGKEHKNILRDIECLDIPDDFRKLNFERSTYKSKNRNGQLLPAYEITFDGFTLLAMGFTGKKAMEFKIKYIKAFRAMEAKLKNVYACGTDAVCGEVAVKEHVRSKPSGKKEIVLSEKAKTEIGGIVKACAPKALSDEDKWRLAETIAAKVTANLMGMKRDDLAIQALALRRQAETYDEAVREYDSSLAKIEKAMSGC